MLQVDLHLEGKVGLQMWRQGLALAEHQKKKPALHLAEAQASCAEGLPCSVQQLPSGERTMMLVKLQAGFDRLCLPAD